MNRLLNALVIIATLLSPLPLWRPSISELYNSPEEDLPNQSDIDEAFADTVDEINERWVRHHNQQWIADMQAYATTPGLRQERETFFTMKLAEELRRARIVGEAADGKITIKEAHRMLKEPVVIDLKHGGHGARFLRVDGSTDVDEDLEVNAQQMWDLLGVRRDEKEAKRYLEALDVRVTKLDSPKNGSISNQ